MLKSLGVPYAIIRWTLAFGLGGLLNNIAWALLRSPFFPVFGSGRYTVQPRILRTRRCIPVQVVPFPLGVLPPIVIGTF